MPDLTDARFVPLAGKIIDSRLRPPTGPCRTFIRMPDGANFGKQPGRVA